MNEQWQELKETIIELRDSDGTGTQQEVCKFLANYMDILEKQMQEPCEDAISRQAVLDMMQMRMSGKELYKAVYDLPPVNPQPCGDLISRKAILEEFENDQYHLEFCKEHHIERSISMEMVRIRLHDLPSVNPQPCENAISRQAVLDIVDSYSESQSNIEDITQDIISDIMALSPVTSQEPCEMTAEEYRQRMIQAFHNANTDELIALCVLPTEKEFEHLEWLLKTHYKKEPCKDAISRQAALNCLTATKLKKFDFILRAREEIKKLPSVTPQPKTGHWIMPVQDDGMSDPMYYQVRCSKCGFDLDPQTWYMELHQYDADKYCPKCGTPMIEPQESEEESEVGNDK